MKVKRSLKKLISYLMILAMVLISLSNDVPKQAKAAVDSNELAATYLNAEKVYLHLRNTGTATYNFNINKAAKTEGATYLWYVKMDKGNPECVTINARNGVVTANKVGVAYIRCKVTLADGTILRPEAKVVVKNNITEVDIKNLPTNMTISAGVDTDFDRIILNTEAGKDKPASGITRWQVEGDTAGVEKATDTGIVSPTKEGEFRIRAICFQSGEKYTLWLKDKILNNKYITAASKWYTIKVEAPKVSITPIPTIPPTVGGSPYIPPTVAVSSITITSVGDTNAIVSGGTLQLNSIISPTNASNQSIVWSVATLSRGTATINSTTGLLTATGIGTVKVTATNLASGVKGTKDITITAPSNNYTALGDSITYGMSAEPNYGYVNLFYHYLKSKEGNENLSLLNLGVPGAKSSDLLSMLQNDAVTRDAVCKAKVITVSIGGNNLLAPVINAFAAAFQLDQTSTTFANDLALALANPNSLQVFNSVIAGLQTNLGSGVQQLANDWVGIIGTIKLLAPQADIYVMTLYNPINQTDPLHPIFDTVIQGINSVICTPNLGYKVADVYNSFNSYQGIEPLVNFGMSTGKLDPHPTTKGHEVINQSYIEAKAIIKKPVITDVSITSDNTNKTKAKIGDTITLTFKTDEPVTKLSSFKINGSNPDTFTNVGNVYTATHLVNAGDTITGIPVTFQINVKNAAGIYSLTVENSTDGSLVTIVDEEPEETELWTMVWSDEFDGKGENLDTNGLDLSKWGYQNGTGAEFGVDGWGNNELEYYSKDNVQVKDGNLVIIPKLETLGGKKYTSARLWTNSTFTKKYGRFEARIKLPAGEGFWPAFWMMPKDGAYGGWAASGEIDIMEAKGRLLQEVSGTLHYGGTWPNNKYSGASYHFEEGQSITDFHTYAIEWEPGEIRWYVDDKLYQTQNNWNTNGADGEEKFAFPAPFDQPFYLLLNLAVGGNFDGGREPNASAFASNPKMEVDYVRVYELTGRAYKTPTDPQIVTDPLPEGARVADSTGNLVYDVNYEQGIIDNREGLEANFGNGWNLVYNQQFGGAATAAVEAIDGRNYAKVNVSSVGTQTYSVQLEQHTTLGKGRWYEFSFDSKADTNRTLNAKLGGGPDRGWTAYSDSYTFNLTNQLQSFKKVFQMTAASDIMTRIEFNCATASGPVWIGNVRLVEIAPQLVDYNASKVALQVTGNLIFNGTFDRYTVDRLAYWNFTLNSGASAAMFVAETSRELTVNILNPGTQASDITVDQRGIQLYQNNQYTLTFHARTTKDRNISVKLLNKDGTTTFAEKDFNLTTMPGSFEMSFTMAKPTDLESKLLFMLGGDKSDVYIDDVKLIKTTVDYTGVTFYPLKNGSFDHDYLSWTTILDSGGAASFSTANGGAKIDITNLGQNPWSVMLIQGGMPFTKGIEYTLTFRAKASVNRNMAVVLENASYTRAFDSNALQLSTDWEIFNFTIKPSVSENLDLKFLMGQVDATAVTGAVFIDDVILQVKNPPVLQAPMIIADATDNKVGNAIDISFQDNEQWTAAIKTVKINDQIIAADKYTVAVGNINFAADNFTEAKNYIILVQAEGYDDMSVGQAIQANVNPPIENTSIVQNGTFDADINPWTNWSDGGISVVAVDGVANINLNGFGTDPWSVQFAQSGFNFEPNVTYHLTFRAKAAVARSFGLDIEGAGYYRYMDKVDNLTTEMQTYSYDFTVTKSEPTKLIFFFGKTGSDITDEVRSIQNTIYIDDVILQVKNPPVLQAPMIIADSTDNKVGNAIEISFQDNEQWRAAIKTVKINGQIISTDKYMATVGNINFAADNFTEAKNYIILVQAEGYDDTSVGQAIQANVNPPIENTSIVQNGTFDADINPWTNWSDGGISVVAVDGVANINLNGFGTDPWSVQFAQSGFNFEPNVTYHLTFRAKAAVARSFGLDIEGAGNYRYMDKVDNLTTEMQTYSYDFTVTKSEPTKLIFFFGKTGSDITDVARSTQNTIYIDDVIITKVDEGGGSTEPSLITVEAESATIFAEGANPEGTAVKAAASTYIEFTVVIPEAGTYKVIYTGKCSPAGVYYELRDSAGTPIAGIGGGPSDDWTMNQHNAILSAGEQTLRVFIAPGAGSTAFLDNVIFELQ